MSDARTPAETDEAIDRMEARSQRIRVWFRARWLGVAAVVFALALVGVLLFGTLHDTSVGETNSLGLTRVEAQLAVLQADLQLSEQQAAAAEKISQQQGVILNGVLVRFFAMQRYLCQAAVAHNATLGGPPAPPGICDVSLPSPSP